MPDTLPNTCLLPVGVVVRQSAGGKEVILSKVIDEWTKIGSLEEALAVRITLYEPSVSGYVSRVTLKFDEKTQWVECTRILFEAKQHMARQKMELEDQLDEVLAQQFLDVHDDTQHAEVPDVVQTE
ncbi:hypothetical protein C8Q76DRAFT_694607 [Earliella scabrosa]|nr:hypothetical protein C8Q76DRAFT_694607 [Earliella scabrosa]